MTTEQAIKKLKSFCHNCNKFPQCVNTDRECFEALDMAIKALEQTDGDLISRKEAIIQIKNSYPEAPFLSRVNHSLYEKWKKDNEGYLICEQIIRELPTIPQTDSVLEEIKAEIEKLPRIKVGNSNSPTLKYCIDEVLLYDLLEK